MSVIAGTVLAYLAFAAVALAQDPTGPTYGGRGADVDSQVGNASDVATTTNLPFTGLDLLFVVAIGLVFLTVGLLTRRLARSRGIAR